MIYMKRMVITYLSLVMVGLSFMACSNDDEKVIVAPEFPECQQIEIQPEQVYGLNFEANQEWRISSDRQWLKFIDGTGKFQSLTGKAGHQTVQFTATNGAQGFEGDKASIQLTMGGLTQVIAELSRTPKTREVKMYTTQGIQMVEIDELKLEELNDKNGVSLNFYANFDWRIDPTTIPDWLTDRTSSLLPLKNLCGEAGQLPVYNKMATVVVPLSERYTDRNTQISLRAISGDYTIQFPISAPGIAPHKILWLPTGGATRVSGQYLWNDKGKQLINEQGGGSNMIETEVPVMCQVLTRDNNYTCHFVQWDSDNRQAVEVPTDQLNQLWAKIEKDENGRITLKAEPNMQREARTLYFFIQPHDTVIDFNDSFSAMGNFNFSDQGYGVKLEQYALYGGFDIWKQVNSMKYEKLAEATQVADASAIIEGLKLTRIDNIYERTFTAAEWDMAEKIDIAALGIPSTSWEFELYNSEFESLGFQAADWAGSFTPGNIYPDGYDKPSYRAVVIGNRKPMAGITDSCLYIVLRENGSDLGTFVLRKE